MKTVIAIVLLLCCFCLEVKATLDLHINSLASNDRGSVVDLVISNKTMNAVTFDMTAACAQFYRAKFRTEKDGVDLKYRSLYRYEEYRVMEDDEPELVELPSGGVTNCIFGVRERIEGVNVGDVVLWQIRMDIPCGDYSCTNTVVASGKGKIHIISRKAFFDSHPELPSSDR